MSNVLFPEFPILIVDDEEQALKSVEISLKAASINNVLCCSKSQKVIEILSKNNVEVILLDLSMPEITGEDLLSIITQDYPDVIVIIITGFNDVNLAVKCIKNGAFDYLVKPVEKNKLVSNIRRAIQFRELKKENSLLKKNFLSAQLETPEIFSEIITKNETMKSVFQYIESIAKTSQPVLIVGETGVGKDLIAKAIHEKSMFKGDFVVVNVAGVDENVFSDTLFGHKKGAFTGAVDSRHGLIEKASGGTLFLDEIGDLTISSQIKLLRLIQNREYYPIGSDVPKSSNVRIIVATNSELEKKQKEGIFRKDLFYRLRTHYINIPPLRKRLEDIQLLLDHFLGKAAESLEKKKPTPPGELLTLLKTYHFPGNIRELEAMVFDAVSKHQGGILSMELFKNTIKTDQEIFEVSLEEGVESNKETLVKFSEELPTIKTIEKLLIKEAMKRADKNQSIAAKLVGITRQALNKRLKNLDKN